MTNPDQVSHISWDNYPEKNLSHWLAADLDTLLKGLSQNGCDFLEPQNPFPPACLIIGQDCSSRMSNDPAKLLV